MFCFILSCLFFTYWPLCFIIFSFIFFTCDWLLLSYIVCGAPEKYHATFPPFQSRVRGRLGPRPPVSCLSTEAGSSTGQLGRVGARTIGLCVPREGRSTGGARELHVVCAAVSDGGVSCG